MKISIAMATYNGAEYIQEQLDSFVAQTQLPDELIVCDDVSSDETIDILTRFSQTAPFKMQIMRNRENFGYARNFEKAISLCTGDIIFLSDQDDFWFHGKIEHVVQEFKAHKSKWLVVNDAMITDAALKPTGLTVAGQLVTAGLPVRQLLLGCCIAFKAELKPLVLPIPYPVHGHDGWINTLGNALDSRHFYPTVLQFYRRHERNTSDWLTTRTTRASKWRLLKEKIQWVNMKGDPRAASASRLEQLQVLKDRLQAHETYIGKSHSHVVDLDAVISRIDQDRCTNELRLSLQQLPLYRRVIGVIKFYLAGGYRQFEGLKSLAKDILR